MLKKLKFGIIGCGGIAIKAPASFGKISGSSRTSGFCDTIIERAEAAAAAYGTSDALVTADYQEVVKQGDIDVIMS